MKLARAASGSDRNRCAAVAAFLGGRIVRSHFEFLHIVRIDAIKITNRIGYRRLVCFDSVDRHIVGAVAGAVCDSRLTWYTPSPPMAKANKGNTVLLGNFMRHLRP